jgi:hypothetical protein
MFFVWSLGTFALLNGVFYVWNPEAYFPLHRFHGVYMEDMTGPIYSVLSGSIIVAVCGAAIHRMEDTLPSWTMTLWIALAVAMVFSAHGELRWKEYQLAVWEGANYLGLVIPVAAGAVVTKSK